MESGCIRCVLVNLLFLLSVSIPSSTLTESTLEKKCARTQFQCKQSGLCIPQKFKCDSYNDCEDKSDENDCLGTTDCKNDKYFRCVNSTSPICIPRRWLCDRETDCKDGSDEQNCSIHICAGNRFTCHSTKKCISNKWRCNGHEDCEDGSDELNCNGTASHRTKITKCSDSYFNHKFLCSDGQQCILKKWYCDGHTDCIDGSDEPTKCKSHYCEANEFHCLNSKCIRKEYQCDGEPDCGDESLHHGNVSSDEDLNVCEDKITCKYDEFKCPGDAKCIPIDQVCNKVTECPSGGDEDPKCNTTTCKRKCANDDDCREMPSGEGVCKCSKGFHLLKDGYTCQDVDECDVTPKPCDHLCTNINGGFTCACMKGYVLQDGGRCRYNESNDLELLFVDVKSIKKYNLQKKYQYHITTNLTRGVALDYDIRTGTVFYTDVMENKIYSSHLNPDSKNAVKENVIIKTGLAVPDGIAVDWIARNIYFAESSASRIDVASYDGSNRASLISVNLTSPRGLALDPKEGYLFITDWGRDAKILRADMDGGNMKVIVTEQVGWPNGITLDLPMKVVYWIDAKYDYIDSVDYDGNNRRNILKGRPFVPHPFAVTIFNDYIYFTDWVKRGIVRFSKTKGHLDYKVILADLSRPMDIQLISAGRQPYAPNPCDNSGSVKRHKCTHLCVIKAFNTSSCLCKPRYKLRPDGFSCELVTKFLIFARTWEVRGIALDNSYHPDVMMPVLGLLSAVGTDFYAAEEYIYFSDVKNDKIGRVNIGKSGEIEWVITKGLEKPVGIAVDWMGGNLFWTDARVNTNSEIAVSKLNGSFKKVLINKGLGKPRAIVIHPKEGYLFYTDWATPAKIGRANMDGTNLKILINGSDIAWPNGLSIDYDENKIFWADARIDRIESINLDGTDRKTVISSTQHSFGLAVDKEFIYWTDWLSKSIHRANRKNTSQVTQIRGEYGGLMDLQIYDKKLQKGSNKCSTANCQQLCLARPDNEVVCACGQNYTLRRDNRTCISGGVRPLRPHKCRRGFFQCDNQRCIKEQWKCDGDRDCSDGSDESSKLCRNATCRDGQFQCANKKCIPDSWHCDGENDCMDGSDEAGCVSQTTCPSNKFQCTDGRCIDIRFRCDGDPDCLGDGSDEINCKKSCSEITQFQCKTDSNCISQTWVCDGFEDCLDGSDEDPDFCHSIKCENDTDFMYCKRKHTCISVKYKCDDVNNCGDWSDELDPSCRNKTDGQWENGKWCDYDWSDKTKVNYTCKCSSNEYQCAKTLQCIPLRAKCDFSKDCEDYSDEANCSFPLCHKNDFLCANKLCISKDDRCDGKDDCGDNSDEGIGCETDVKLPSMDMLWKCNDTGKLISLNKTCDGVNDCGRADDEGPSCALSNCDIKNGGCSHYCHNTPRGARCYCRKGFHLSDDSQTCVDINECENKLAPCSQICHNTKGSFKCKCHSGYMLRNDRVSCSAGDPSPLLIFSDHKEVRQINPITHEAMPLVGNLKSAIGIDYHWEDQMLYWSDVSDDKIERMKFDGTEREEIVNRGMNSPEGLAVDWIANNIYWTDMKLDTIEAAKTDGKMRSVIISNKLDAPRALSVDPASGLMFWTDWGSKAHIERADMDGGNRKVLIDKNLVWPNGLTLDVHMRMLYFIDAKLDILESMDYNGNNRHTVAQGGPIKHPFALTVFEDYIYFTDWAPESIRRLHRIHGGSKLIFKNDLKKPMDIQVLHPGRQPRNKSIINYCKNSKCSHLCVLKPKGYACKCPFGYTLMKEEKTKCESIKEVLLYARRLEIRGISLNPNDTVDKITPITGTQNAIGVDFHYKKQYIYWTDVSRDSISRIFLNGTGREDIIPSGLPAPDGIAIDWVADNMYWTDADTNCIEVARLDGRYRKVIVSTDLDQPRAIVLHPAKGLMIWTDWGKSIIEKASLDGSNRQTLVKKDIGYPNGVTIDFDDNRVYWCDAQRDIISSVHLDGSNQQRVNVSQHSVVYPFGITTFRGNLYWTDWGRRAIMRSKVNGSDITEVRTNYLSLMGIVVYHEDRQKGTNACGKNASLCSHLCFAINQVDYKCGCATGFDLKDDNSSCIGAKTFLLFSTTTEVRAIPLTLTESESESIVPILGLKSSYAIDYHYKTGAIYVTDDSKDIIYRVQQDGSHLVPIITTGLERPQGIAVDWVADNLYWTDAGTKSIEVAHLNGTRRLVLISSDIHSPRAIVLYPSKGIMYWTDWDVSNPKIERASMDGSNRLVIVNATKMQKSTQHKIGWPNGITIDYDSNQIYWVDAKHDIMVKMNLDGEELQVILNKNGFQKFSHPYAVSVDSDFIYWTDWQEKSIYRMMKRNMSARPEVMRKQLDHIRDVHAYDASRQPGTGVCGHNNGGCQHLCLATSENTRRCVCTSGELSKDQKSCDEVTDYLIFAKRHEIQFLDLNPQRKGSSPHPSIKSLQNAIGIDFDFKNKMIYYSDIFKKEIGSIKVDGSNKKVLVTGLKTPDGIAYDWTTGMLYWTDAQENTVNRLTTKGEKEVLVHEKLDEPRAIALSPCDGLMYWTDWGQKPYIRRATLNGHNPKAIVETNLGWPNGLSVDMEAGRIYWADARTDRIESADLDGLNRRMVISNVPHVFGVTLYGNYIYWTDWVTRSIIRADKRTGHHQITLKEKLDAQPMDIKVFTQGRQNCNRTQCGKGKRLLDGYRCVSTHIRDECKNKTGLRTDKFICSNGECTDTDNLCDGDYDCGDKSDESALVCSKHVCASYRFKCKNSWKCIEESFRCDTEKDCEDGSDEENCQPKKCATDQFTCFDGTCIAKALHCNGHPDCVDKSDETTDCPRVTCHPGFFSCDDHTRCIPMYSMCDGYNTCDDKSDELDANCRPTCNLDEKLCANKRKCVPLYWICDGDDDCPDKSDELNCQNFTCPGDQHQCSDGTCIDRKFMCNGEEDCNDGSDETHANCSRKSCNVNQFQCLKTRRCILKSYQCDGDNDCGDKSDESEENGCVKDACRKGEFKCNSKMCIREHWRCDGEDDCGDNSDEEDCTCDQHTMFRCKSGQCIAKSSQCNKARDCEDGSDEEKNMCKRMKCGKGFFQCLTGVPRCVPEASVCNDIHDCKDKSDEKGCHINECENHQCSQGCVDKKIGYECNCTFGYHLADDGRTCISNCDLYVTHGCSQTCHMPNENNGVHICNCTEGYTLDIDGQSCKHNTKEKPKLLIANKHHLSSLSISKRKKSYEVLQDGLHRAIAVDYDWKTKTYYWLDLLPRQISLGSFIDKQVAKLNFNLRDPFDICVDWIGRNLYFTDRGISSIFVSNLDGQYVKRLYKDPSYNPLAIVCHPDQGYLYFTSESSVPSKSGAISRIGMDGSSHELLINDNIKLPYGLAFDEITQTLYWSDFALKRIEYIVLGKSQIKRTVLKHGVGEVYALSLFEDYLYYSLLRPFSLHRIHRWKGVDSTVIKKSKYKFLGIKVMHPLLQRGLSGGRKSPCSSSKCNLCVLSPGDNSQCLCPDGYHLNVDNVTCVNKWDISYCVANQFKCDNGKCFSKSLVCDGVDHCGDRSDERNCTTAKCSPDMFQCANGNCTKKFDMCDGDNDCSDGSDELNCNNTICLSFQFRCNNYRCISRRQRCNGQDNCGDNSDEVGCVHTPSACNKGLQFQCANGKCIRKQWRCDGDADCSDKSDEAPEYCKKIPCKQGFFRCNNTRCIMERYRCDGDDDCHDNSDEDIHACNNSCDPKRQIACDNNQCISKEWKCDGDVDCSDESDEEGCPNVPCPNEFLCDNKNCVNNEWRCDADDDCGDNSDERNCSSKCKHGHFKCKASDTCINIAWRCDNEIDCKDRSDELNCSRVATNCSSAQFKCKDGSCIRMDWVCDNYADCFDKSDERADLCTGESMQCNSEKQFQCDSGFCVHSFKRCDGNRDCEDGSDEKFCKPKCHADEFDCGNTECISAQKRCDFFPDCSNLADEKYCKHTGDNRTYCLQECGLSSNCVKNGSIFLCTCERGHKFNEKRECVDINECVETPSSCDQMCENTKGGHKCTCKYRYGHSKTEHCKLQGPPAFVVLPTSNKIMIVPTHNPKKQSATYINVGLPRITAFDFFYGNSTRWPILVTGDGKITHQIVVLAVNFMRAANTVSQAPREFEGPTLPLLRKRRRRYIHEPLYKPLYKPLFKIPNTSPSVIVVDYLGANIFWVHNDKEVYISSVFNGTTIRSVLRRSVRIETLALNPVEGVMYWCENSYNPIIFRAKMNGEDVVEFVTSKLQFPTGLAVDYPSSRLFWTDMKKHTIESLLFNASSRITTIDNFRDPRFVYPNSIDVFEDSVYGIMKTSGKLFKIEKFGKGRMVILKEDIHKTSYIRLHQRNRQLVPEKDFVNPCLRAYCNQLCVVIQGNANCLCNQNDLVCGRAKCDSRFCNDNGVCKRTRYGENICSCNKGFTKESLCKERCKCQNGGTCISNGRRGRGRGPGYTCKCPSDYFGDECETSCRGYCGDGECRITDNKATCICQRGLGGSGCANATCSNLLCKEGKVCRVDPDLNVALCESVDIQRSIRSSKDLVIAMSVLVLLLVFASIVFYIVWKRRVTRQFAPKKLTNMEMEMENPIYSNNSATENGDARVVMEYDRGFPTKFKYFPSKKEKKEKEKSVPRKIFRDSQGNYTNFTNSDDNLNEDPYNEKALLVCTDDEDIST